MNPIYNCGQTREKTNSIFSSQQENCSYCYCTLLLVSVIIGPEVNEGAFCSLGSGKPHVQEDDLMAASVKTVTLAAFTQQADTCFSAAVSGDLIKVTDGGQETYLIGSELLQFITDCLFHYEIMMTQ